MGRWSTVPRPPAAPWSLFPVIWSPPLILLVPKSIIILLHSSIMLNTNKTTAATIITITIWSILLGENTKKSGVGGSAKTNLVNPLPHFGRHKTKHRQRWRFSWQATIIIATMHRQHTMMIVMSGNQLTRAESPLVSLLQSYPPEEAVASSSSSSTLW